MRQMKLLGLVALLLLSNVEGISVHHKKKAAKKLHVDNKADAKTDGDPDAAIGDIVAFSEAVAEGKTAEEAVKEAAE